MLSRTELKEIASMDKKDGYFVSLYLNVDPMFNKQGDYVVHLKNMLKGTVESSDKDVYKKAKDDLGKIDKFVLINKRIFKKGLAVVSSSSNSFWREYHLGIPVKNELIVDKTPYIKPLLDVLDNYPGYAVLLVGKEFARFFVIQLREIVEYGEVHTPDRRSPRTCGASDHGGLRRWGDLLVGQAYEGPGLLWRVDANGILHVVAGVDGRSPQVPGPPGYGDGGAAVGAQFGRIQGVLALPDMLILADDLIHSVRVIDTVSGIVTRLAGNGNLSYGGDGGPVSGSQLFEPRAVHFDAAGSAYIIDQRGSALRVVNGFSGVITSIAPPAPFTFSPVAVAVHPQTGHIYFSKGDHRVCCVDMIVEDAVIVEFKAVDRMDPVFKAQILSYTRMTSTKLGFLINFNVPCLREGVQRIIL